VFILLQAILISLAIWLVVFIPSGGIGSFIAERLKLRAFLAGVPTQILFIILSLITGYFTLLDLPSGLGLTLSMKGLIDAVIIAIFLAGVMFLLTRVLFKDLNYEPPFTPKSLYEIDLARFCNGLMSSVIFK
jgi:hypothetical protein